MQLCTTRKVVATLKFSVVSITAIADPPESDAITVGDVTETAVPAVDSSRMRTPPALNDGADTRQL